MIFAVNDKTGYVVTNAHVVPRVDGKLTVIALNGVKYPATPAAIEHAYDLAILAIWADEKTPFVPLAPTYPDNGQQIWQAGYPAIGGAQRLTKRYGRSLGLGGVSGQAHVCRLDFPVISGDSGSPVFNERGEVCAVVWGTSDNNSMCVPVNYLHKLIQDKCQYACPPGGYGRQPPRSPYGQPPPLNPQQPPPPLGQQPPKISPEVDSIKKNLDELKQLILKIEPKPGPQGPVGPIGPKGDPGPKGDTTDLSELFSKLQREIQSIKGPKGDKGERGLQGPPGPKGESAKDYSQEIQALRKEVELLRTQRYRLNIYGPGGEKLRSTDLEPGASNRLKLVPPK